MFVSAAPPLPEVLPACPPELVSPAQTVPPPGSATDPHGQPALQLEALAARLADPVTPWAPGAPRPGLQRVYGWLAAAAGRRRIKCLLDSGASRCFMGRAPLRNRKRYAKASKCLFGCSSVGFLGHAISERGVAVDPRKVAAVAEWATPTWCTDVRRFVRAAVYALKTLRPFLLDKPFELHADNASLQWLQLRAR